jgi:hypothetical protein
MVAENNIIFSNISCCTEKNWGQGFPQKWAWLQCNSFSGQPYLSVTAAAAVRNLFNVPGVQEEVGLIGIHHEGKFYDLGVMNGRMRWSIDPWGKWNFWAKGDDFEALMEASCDQGAGVRLRAPTANEGLYPSCKDTFAANVRLRLWALDRTGIRKPEPIVDAVSSSCAAEVGGGSWWDSWEREAKVNGVYPFQHFVDGKVSMILPLTLPRVLAQPSLRTANLLICLQIWLGLHSKCLWMMPLLLSRNIRPCSCLQCYYLLDTSYLS